MQDSGSHAVHAWSHLCLRVNLRMQFPVLEKTVTELGSGRARMQTRSFDPQALAPKHCRHGLPHRLRSWVTQQEMKPKNESGAAHGRG